MFDFVRRHTRVLFFVLLLLVIPSFVLIGNGMDPFRTAAGQRTVASVAGHDITQMELDRVNQRKLDQIRREAPNEDIKNFDTPAFRQNTLDEIVRERVLAEAAKKFQLAVSEDRLKRVFTTDPQFAFWRNPDGTVNKAILAAQGMSSAAFAQRLQTNLAEQQVVQGVASSSLVPAAVATPALEAFFQQREVQVQRFEPKAYAAKVEVTDAELETFYKEPFVAARFLQPEQVDAEYVVLDLDTIAKGLAVDESELKQFYEANKTRYGNPEERRASHILIAADKSANDETRAKAKAKAEALRDTLKKASPTAFADAARKNSQDAGSAKSGGDLGFLTRDVVKPFADALFALQAGEVSPVVETDEGYHIIQLTDRRGGDVRSFESVRPELLVEARKAEAQKKFSEASTEFANMAEEQSGSLTPLAERWKLEVRTAPKLSRTSAPTDPVLGNPKFIEAVFGEEALREKRNTPAIETGPGQMVVARVTAHTPARQPELAEVQAPVRAAYIARKSAELARKDGEAKLAELKAAPPATLGQPVTQVSRAQPANLPQSVLEQILRAPATALPTVVGRDLQEQGYVLALVTKVSGVDPAVAKEPDANRQRYAQVWDDAEAKAYLDALKKRFKAEIK